MIRDLADIGLTVLFGACVTVGVAAGAVAALTVIAAGLITGMWRKS